MSEPTNLSEVAAAAELGRENAGVKADVVDPEKARLLLVRERKHADGNHGQEVSGVIEWVRIIDLEPYCAMPTRRSGQLSFDEPGSFERYVNEFKSEGATRLYASQASGQIVAILNDDDLEDEPAGAWRDHRATLTLQRTPEWQAWRKADRKYVSQEDFAEFLEEHLGDIKLPAAADLVELARTFSATNNVAFRSAVNLTSGETQFRYEQELEGKAGTKGEVAIPAEFVLSLAIYEGTDWREVTARLRYRLADGNLRLGYVLIDADKLERDAFKSEVDNSSASTGIEALYGTPAAPPTAPRTHE